MPALRLVGRRVVLINDPPEVRAHNAVARNGDDRFVYAVFAFQSESHAYVVAPGQGGLSIVLTTPLPVRAWVRDVSRCWPSSSNDSAGVTAGTFVPSTGRGLKRI